MRGGSIVVVEDEEDIRELLLRILEGAGYRAVGTGRPLEAKALVESVSPDVVISDIAMPGLDGYGVVKQLQSDPKTAHHPVIFLTANRDFSERVRAFRFGVVEYITKPFSREVLLHKIDRVMQGVTRRPGVMAIEWPLAELLDQLRQESRTGVVTVRTDAGESRLVVRAGEVVEGVAPLAAAATAVEFRELDPSRDSIVPHREEVAAREEVESDLPSFEGLAPEMRTVLVADDSAAFRAFLKALLERQGLEVLEARDGVEALRVALEGRPWLILSDVEMPNCDGFELCRRVRESVLIGSTPFIFLSGWDDHKGRYKGLEAGADEYLSKHTPVRELMLRIHSMFRRYVDAGRRANSALEGRLELIGVAGVLQMCHLSRLSGTLHTHDGDRHAEVRFRSGEMVGASCRGLTGVEAVFEYLSWTRGRFEFASSEAGPAERLGESFEQLLIEGARRLDERRRTSIG